MADDIKTMDVIRQKGKIFINIPLLFGAYILYVSREGIGMTSITTGVPANEREVLFGVPSVGNLAFYSKSLQDEHIHIIYKPGTGLSI